MQRQTFRSMRRVKLTSKSRSIYSALYFDQLTRKKYGQECIPVGCVAVRCSSRLGCVCVQVCVCMYVCVQGVSGRGVYTPLVDRMTDACENITFPQLLLGTVITETYW